jgi:hypothetical protein
VPVLRRTGGARHREGGLAMSGYVKRRLCERYLDKWGPSGYVRPEHCPYCKDRHEPAERVCFCKCHG